MESEDRDPRSPDINSLHRWYREGRLRLLIGAGTSIPSGFPTWDELNVGLLREHLMDDGVPVSIVETLAHKLYSTLGREGSADFVRTASENDGKFHKIVGKVLYAGRDVLDLPVRSVHRQIAAMSPKLKIYTTNFDPLIELALSDRFNHPWESFRSPRPDRDVTETAVEHIHGWIDPDGNYAGQIILTESQYIELTREETAAANSRLVEVFAPVQNGQRIRGGTLIIGMSLADANLRRLLYHMRSTQLTAPDAIYAVVLQEDNTLQRYARDHWKRRGIDLIAINNYEELPNLLRDVQYGVPDAGASQSWIEQSCAHLVQQRLMSLIFEDSWQEAAFSVLEMMRERVRTVFAVHTEEHIEISLFIPLRLAESTPKLYCIASSHSRRSGREAVDRAEARSLGIQRFQQQGVAGVAFVTGSEREAIDDGPEIDNQFTADMKRDWTRNWRSIVAIPIHSGPNWLPVGVVVVTSNLPEPFWRCFGSRHSLYVSQFSGELVEGAKVALGI